MDWRDAKQRFSTPAFDSLREPLECLIADAEWPCLARLNECAAGIRNFRGRPVRFVTHDPATDAAAWQYESRIAERGEVPTRENWHDFFNALSWIAFPQTKGAISEMHERLIAALGETETRSRSTPRDVLTLFDEGGIIVASSDESLLDLIRRFEWKTLFVERRADAIARMRFYLFGHSMHEKALEPYVGVTAKAVLFPVDNAFLATSPAAQLRHIDRRAAAWLVDERNLSSSKNLSPLPWLGVPGWWKENELPAFYDNAQYFRGGRMRDTKTSLSPRGRQGHT